ncbi:hypothetical protein BUALT_Bualt06G0093700 [Buddleja alternifolia]|uniref:J domain-containing protein n=1 Tax=Buddleja alternifolia TaxID=168488 RepID=A0AAV6XKM6_9LAMI|nr:hypothetical protein BUALT_Bualt06G0093700 [Buddleja alternifolia]
MECNKDEALRAKSIAEDKLGKKDFAGAKKFALKAQTLYPGLDGIPQMLTTLDVYISAENKVGGEVDWYAVLGVNPSADEETIRKQYRKLALTLHPDKNKSIGADGAFKLISEAWSLLSDKAKRLVYNQRRGSKEFQQRVPVHTGGPSAPSRPNGVFNFASRSTSVPKTQNNSGKAPFRPTPTLSRQRTDTFWTLCHKCMMHYEYLKMYLNTTLICPNCSEAFTALETAPPFSFSSTSSNDGPTRTADVPGRNGAAAQKPGSSQAGSNSFRYPHYQHPLSRTANVGSADPSIAAKAANVVQQAQDKLKRSSTESSRVSPGWEGFAKKNKLDEGKSRYGMSYNMAQGNGGSGTASGTRQGSRFYGFSGTYHQPNSTRDLTTMETRKMLMVKARNEILNKVNMWKSETKAADTEKTMSKQSKKEKRDENGKSDLSSTMLADQDERGQVSADNASKEDPADSSMNVPDPDFHDFDQDRTESSFGDNEVWAAYDDDDGMPRFYALISKVMSRKPFKLKISWLNSRTTTEFTNLDWVGSGFYKTCGEFRVGRYETCNSINSFSQRVHWSKGPRGTILILPQKGDVWALYKNWSPDWDEHTPDEVIHKYEMVTVLDDYNEEKGVSIAPLVKVVGFKTVFRPSFDPEVVKWVPKEEMFRFSHRVPNHFLTGQEGQNAPKGCLELDPAATPLELLQVLTEAKEDQTDPPNRSNADEEVATDLPR